MKMIPKKIKGDIMIMHGLVNWLLFIITSMVFIIVHICNLYSLFSMTFHYFRHFFYNKHNMLNEIVLIEKIFTGFYQPAEALSLLFKICIKNMTNKKINQAEINHPASMKDTFNHETVNYEGVS